MDPCDELNEYLSGGSALSRDYRSQNTPEPPHALDRLVLRAALGRPVKSPCLAPLAFAASVLLSLAMVAAIVIAPASSRRASDAPRMTPVHLYNDSNDTRVPSQWLADIAALRRAGRLREAAVQMQRFHSLYPHYIVPTDE
jgi:hypothetical protein